MRFTAGLLVALVCWGLASTSSAAASAPDSEAGPGPAIEEITITARKVEESQQSVPVSVNALSGKDLEQDVVLNVQDLQEHISGLVVAPNSQGGAPTFSIRAAKQDNGTDGGVAVYLDDMPLVSTLAIANSTYDMASIDVLKGPQGTLFGVNATGGAIVFRANRPTDRFEGYLDLGVGNFDRREGEFMVNVPVADVLQLRLAGDVVDRPDGFVTNVTPVPGIPSDLSTDRHQSLRFSAMFNWSPDLTNLVVADYYHENDAPRQAIPVAYTKSSGITAASLIGWDKVSLGDNPTGIDLPLFNRAQLWGVTDTLNWAIGQNGSVKNVLGYRRDHTETFEDSDGTNLDKVNGRTQHNNSELVEEITLHLASGDRGLRYTGGVFLSRTTRDDGVSYILAQLLAPANKFFPGSPAFPVPQNGHNLFERELHSRAVYSQLDYDLTSQLTATLGARYNWDSGSLIDSQRVSRFVLPDPTGNFYSGACQTLILSAYPNFNPATCTASTSAAWRAPSFNFTLTDHFAARSMAYAKVAAGYQAGGFNNQIEESTLQTFQPERVTEYELGVKSDWRLLGRAVRTNFDVFHGISHDKQEVENGSYANGSQFVGVFNAGSLAYSGLDAEAVAYITDMLELSADWTHVRAKYNSFSFPAVGLLPATNLTGAPPAQIPRDTLALGATVTWPLSPTYGQLSTHLTGYYRARTNFHDVVTLGTFPPNSDSAGGYTTANFSTEWNGVMQSHFDVSLWVKNVFDRHYFVYASPTFSAGYATVTYGDPRTFGMHVRYNF